MVLHRLYMQQIILFTSLYQDMEQGEVSFCIDSYTLLNQHESGDKPLPNNFQNSNGVAAIVASGLRQLSLRGYGNRRFGVTAIIASGLRQSSLRGYDNHRFGVTTIIASGLRQMPLRGYDKRRCGTSVNTAVC